MDGGFKASVDGGVATVSLVTYFPDGSPYSYWPGQSQAVNVGWLDSEHEFPIDEVSDEFVAALARLCRRSVETTRGYHRCEFCLSVADGATGLAIARDADGEFLVGHAEIRARHPTGTIFAAPNLIIHYVKEHGYRPPDAFIDAVLGENPLPA